jgi:hypothetical protein
MNFDEEEQLINTFKYVHENMPDLINLIDPKNKDRLMKMHDKYNK